MMPTMRTSWFVKVACFSFAGDRDGVKRIEFYESTAGAGVVHVVPLSLGLNQPARDLKTVEGNRTAATTPVGDHRPRLPAALLIYRH